MQSPECNQLSAGLHADTEIAQHIVFLGFLVGFFVLFVFWDFWGFFFPPASPMVLFILLHRWVNQDRELQFLFSSPYFLDNFNPKGCGEALDVALE